MCLTSYTISLEIYLTYYELDNYLYLFRADSEYSQFSILTSQLLNKIR